MNKKIRVFQILSITIATAFVSFGGQAFALTAWEQPASDYRSFQSAILDEEFIRAIKVGIEIESVEENLALEGALQLYNRNSRKTRWYEIAYVPLKLTQTLVEKNSMPDGTKTISTTYTVDGIPKDMVDPDKRVTIRIAKSEGKKQSAQLTVRNADGQMFRQIPLLAFTPPVEKTRLLPDR